MVGSSHPGGWVMRQIKEADFGKRAIPHMDPGRKQPGQLKRVLCIDDEVDFQSVIRISLERLGGIQAHFCTDPQLAMAKAREVNPDLILLDYMMPDINGLEFIGQHADRDARLAPFAIRDISDILAAPETSRQQAVNQFERLVVREMGEQFAFEPPGQIRARLRRGHVEFGKPFLLFRHSGLPLGRPTAQ